MIYKKFLGKGVSKMANIFRNKGSVFKTNSMLQEFVENCINGSVGEFL